MPYRDEPDVITSARAAAEGAASPLLLAVSGGIDSMSMLDAMAEVARDRIAAVATFDHATGPHSTRAAALVRREARRRGLEVVVGRMPTGSDASNGLEAMWRAARHRFLRDTAARVGARIATAHTRDDQIETVLLRTLRGAGARGLAGLAARGAIVRPLVGVSRATIERYARERGLPWVEDPSNSRRAFLRNRVRHDLLPALRRVDPDIDDALWRLGSMAAAWRAELEALVDDGVRFRRPDDHTLVVAASELAGYDRDSLEVLWTALAGRAGVVLDRRGTTRCATFTMSGPRRGAIPLSGGWRLEANRGELVLRRPSAGRTTESVLPARGEMDWGAFRFSVHKAGGTEDEWSAALIDGAAPSVRRWRAGDRLAPSRGQRARRVSRYLTEARIGGSARADWPVVVQGGEVVWIPGVRRSDAATERSGRPARHYICERAHS